ncbi:MAG: Rieske 2Fe-2S domain-containing protein, partial [Acidimicrobiales bacterium]
MSATLVAPENVTARQENSVYEGASPGTATSWSKVAQLWPRQSWYVVAFAHELSPEHLVARTVLGEHLVMFRSPEGAPVVLADRCPHRQYPLSKGSLA